MATFTPEARSLPADLRPRGGVIGSFALDRRPGLLLRGVTLSDGTFAEVRIVEARIVAVVACGELDAIPGDEVHDLPGYVLLPAMAEPHVHLDKAFTADRFAIPGGDIVDAIDAWHAHRPTLSVRDIAERARAGALLALSHGATAIRTHVDIGDGIGLRGIEALLQVREELREEIDVQVVAAAFPLTGRAGAENRAMLGEALRMGADVVGGAPHVDLDPTAHLEYCLSLASEWGRPLDLHMDEHTRTDGVDLFEMALALSGGFEPGAVASHCVSLGMQPAAVQERISNAVSAAGIGVIALPQTNLLLQARGVETGQPRGLTALRALRRAGVTVAAGGDNVQDPFNPIGCCDPLQTAQLLVAAAQVSPEEAYALVSTGARRLMGLEPARIEPGAVAELVAVSGSSICEAVATATEDRVVVRNGRISVLTSVRRKTADREGMISISAGEGAS